MSGWPKRVVLTGALTMAVCVVGCAAPPGAVNIVTKSGMEYSGRIVTITDDSILVRSRFGSSVKKIPTSNIYDITGRDYLKTVVRMDPKEAKLADGYRQRQVFFEKVKNLFLAQRFDKLERIAATARPSRERFANGEWKSLIFYMAIAGSYGDDPKLGQEKKIIGLLKKWHKEYPSSPVPRVALTDAYQGLGWIYRGNGESNTVTAFKASGFHSALKQSWKIGESLLKEGVQDGYLYETLLWTATGLGADKTQLYSILNAGLKNRPDFEVLYETFGPFLLPRWLGAPGEVERFADWAVKRSGDNELYAYVAYSIFDYVHEDSFLKFNFDWRKIKKGYRAMLHQFPDSLLDMNEFARLACFYKDAKTAQEIFHQTGYLWDPQAKDIWGDFATYIKWKKWAERRAMFPEIVQPDIDRMIMRGDREGIEKLLTTGADINQVNDKGETPLVFALNNNKPGMAEFFIQQGADIHKAEADGYAPIHGAAAGGELGVLKDLVKRGADVNRATKLGVTPLHLAVADAQENVVNYLIHNKKINVNAQDARGMTPLHWAVKYRQDGILAYLLQSPTIDVNKEDKLHRTPLTMAEQEGFYVVYNILKQKGARESKGAVAPQDMERVREYVIQGSQFVQAKKLDQALKYFKLANKLDPDEVRINTAIARIYFAKQDAPKAVQYAQKSIKLDPSKPYAYYVMGACLFELKQPESRYLPYLRKFIQMKPNSRETKFILQHFPQLRH